MSQVLTGNAIQWLRVKMLIMAMDMELKHGIRMTSRAKARSPFAIAKDMFNIAGKPRNVDVYNYVKHIYDSAMAEAKAQKTDTVA